MAGRWVFCTPLSLPLSSFYAFDLIDLWFCYLVGAIWFRFRCFSLMGLWFFGFMIVTLWVCALFVFFTSLGLWFFGFMIVTLWIVKTSSVFRFDFSGFFLSTWNHLDDSNHPTNDPSYQVRLEYLVRNKSINLLLDLIGSIRVNPKPNLTRGQP